MSHQSIYRDHRCSDLRTQRNWKCQEEPKGNSCYSTNGQGSGTWDQEADSPLGAPVEGLRSGAQKPEPGSLGYWRGPRERSTPTCILTSEWFVPYGFRKLSDLGHWCKPGLVSTQMAELRAMEMAHTLWLQEVSLRPVFIQSLFKPLCYSEIRDSKRAGRRTKGLNTSKARHAEKAIKPGCQPPPPKSQIQ